MTLFANKRIDQSAFVYGSNPIRRDLCRKESGMGKGVRSHPDCMEVCMDVAGYRPRHLGMDQQLQHYDLVKTQHFRVYHSSRTNNPPQAIILLKRRPDLNPGGQPAWAAASEGPITSTARGAPRATGLTLGGAVIAKRERSTGAI
jgi:hypothetical protein